MVSHLGTFFMNRLFDFFGKLFPIFVCLPAVIYVLYFSGYGLDLTDESSYINWISDPWLYPLSVTQYGFFYHPLYELVGGSIALLRGLNILLTVGLASLLGFVIFRRPNDDGGLLDVGMSAAASIPFGFVALLYITNWLVTPNYNSLNLQGLLISATALVLIDNSRDAPASSLRALGPFVLLGIGGWIVFLAKPPSAACLAVVVFVYLLSVRKLSLPTLFIAAGVSIVLLLLTALAIDGSVPKFVARLSDSISLSNAMDHRYAAAEMLRIDKLTLSTAEATLILSLGAFFGIVLFLGTVKGVRAAVFWLAFVVGTLVVGFLILTGACWRMPPTWNSQYTVQIFAFPLGMALALLALYARGLLSSPAVGTLRLAVALFVFPYAFAFGTNGNYWPSAASAGVFGVAAALVVVRGVYRDWRTPRTVLSITLLPFALAAAILGVGMEHPYRQSQPVRENNQVVDVGDRGARLTLSSDFAAYTRRLQAIARESGFRTGAPLIDLTGHDPGASFILGAIPVGQAWMIGGYPGSHTLAAAALRRVSCATLATAWLLIEPNGPRAITQTVLGGDGMRFEPVGSLSSTTGSYANSYQQYLMRPVHDQGTATQLCEKKRKTHHVVAMRPR
ncbi:hypothetical protein [Mesorhizobium sp. A623]